MTESLYQSWIAAKVAETKAIAERRAIEDALIKKFRIEESLEGTESREDGEYTIKIVGRMSRTIDAEKLQDVATENGLYDHLSHLFRWKPEINIKAWKAADESITSPLMAAITTKPSRPSFSITTKTQGE